MSSDFLWSTERIRRRNALPDEDSEAKTCKYFMPCRNLDERFSSHTPPNVRVYGMASSFDPAKLDCFITHIVGPAAWRRFRDLGRTCVSSYLGEKVLARKTGISDKSCCFQIREIGDQSFAFPI